jgi:hypothetical protein
LKRGDNFVARINPVADSWGPQNRRRFLESCVASALVVLHGGCGYTIRAPFDTEIKTVFVPVAISNTFQRDLNIQLTGLVQQEIMHRTPYKVVGTFEDADTILEMKINYAQKNLVVENPTNLPLELNGTMTIMAKWTHNPPTEIEKKRAPTMIMETVNFIPQVGESTSTAYYMLNQRLAQQIVDMMEQPWYSEGDLK